MSDKIFLFQQNNNLVKLKLLLFKFSIIMRGDGTTIMVSGNNRSVTCISILSFKNIINLGNQLKPTCRWINVI